MVIAIDGPAGAGKSTVARAVAEALGFRYLDSGAMYRALALSLLERPGDPPSRARELSIELGDTVALDGRDVGDAIRTPQVSELASRVATDKRVRAALARKQRDALARGDWVAEGRDIGTVVAPDADLKVYLTASAEERARRRATDLGADVDVVLRDQALRDALDKQREHSPLRAADDAIRLDTTGKPVDEVVRAIVDRAAVARR